MTHSPFRPRLRPTLSGVSETLLWPLWHRAAYAAGPLAILPDPVVSDVVTRLAYPFRERFGLPRPYHALRARHGDAVVARHLAQWPGAAVVSLGDGLETQFWRTAPGVETRWIGVELPEVIDLRAQLLPADPRRIEIAASATDSRAWLDVAGQVPPVFLAAGLFMYLEPDAVAAIIADIFTRYPRATLHFDTVPPGFAAQTRQGFRLTAAYTVPPMPWGIAHDRIATFVGRLVPGASVTVHTYADEVPWMFPGAWALALSGVHRNALAPCLVDVTGRA